MSEINRMLKKPVSKARGSETAGAYSTYVRTAERPRTPLTGFFSILRNFKNFAVGAISPVVKIGALIPVKAFAGAKQRLSSRLSMPEREQLMRAMVYDVLTQVRQARGICQTFVVTGSADVAQWVRQLDAKVIREETETGETNAVHFALSQIEHRGLDAALVLPGDVPLVQVSDIESVLEAVIGKATRPPFAALVPSHDRMGTNALLLSPPEILRLRFGYDSFCYHLNELVTRRLPIHIVENRHIALDIDEPEDLERLLPQLERGRTHERLLAMKDNGSTFFRNTG